MRFPCIIWEFPVYIHVPCVAPKSILCGPHSFRNFNVNFSEKCQRCNFPPGFWVANNFLKDVESLLHLCKATVLTLPSLIIFHYCPPHYAKTAIKEKSAGCSCQKQCLSLSHQTLFTTKVCSLQSCSSVY